MENSYEGKLPTLSDEISDYIYKCKEESLFIDTQLYGCDSNSNDPIEIHGLVFAAFSSVLRSLAEDITGTWEINI